MSRESRHAKKVLLWVLCNWDKRRTGKTHAMLHGTKKTNGIVLVYNGLQADMLYRTGLKKEQIVILDECPEKLQGLDKPIIMDHYVASYLIRLALQQSKEEGRCEALKIKKPKR